MKSAAPDGGLTEWAAEEVLNEVRRLRGALAIERARTDHLVGLHWKHDSAPPDSVEERAALDELDEACRNIARYRSEER
jgi:hypothetical protein